MSKQQRAKYLGALLLVCFGFSDLPAQQLSLHSTPNGIYVELVGGTTMAEGWTIQRLRNREAPERRYALRAGVERRVYQQRLADFNRWFPNGATLPELMADSLWALRQSERPITHPAFRLASGQAILDTTALAPGTYEYQLLNAQGRTIAQQSIRHPRVPRLPELHSAENPVAKQAELRWHTKDPQEMWSAIVFRQDPVTARFERIYPQVLAFRHPEVADSVSVIVRDTSLKQPGHWRYYIEPVDRFGNRSRVAEVGEVLVLDEESQHAFIELRTEAMPEQPAIRLRWTGEQSIRLQAIRVYRSRTYGGRYELRATLPAGTKAYIDDVPIAREPFFYYLEAEDLGGQNRRSAIVSDYYDGAVAASVPQAVTAEAREHGIAISWESDQQRNYGYVVYRGTDATGEMISISPLLRGREQAWRYLDTSRQLQPGVVYSYAVRGVSPTDEQSELSERVFVTCPGEVFVPAPRDVRIRMREGAVILSWEDLPARAARVIGYQVYRKAQTDDAFERISSTRLDLHDNRFVDENLPGPGNYTYAVSAIDVNGKESAYSAEKSINTAQQVDLRPEQVEGVQTATANVLVWPALPYPELVQSIRVYRASEGGHFVQLRQLEPQRTRFDDQQIEPDKTYRYQLVVIDNAGEASSPTEVLTMRRK